MKLLIAGSRSIVDFDLSDYVSPETELIISGGAEGVDSLAERYADQHRISKLILRPRYELYGHAAPLKRNSLMVEPPSLVAISPTNQKLNLYRKNNISLKKICVID